MLSLPHIVFLCPVASLTLLSFTARAWKQKIGHIQEGPTEILLDVSSLLIGWQEYLSTNGFSFAMASQPFHDKHTCHTVVFPIV